MLKLTYLELVSINYWNSMFIRLYILLASISLILLTWQNIGMDKSIRLNKDSVAYAISDAQLLDDSPLASTASITVSNQHKVLNCHIRNLYDYPFCEISFNLVNFYEQPLDLSDYTRIIIKANYSGPKSDINSNLRLQLRNFEPDYSNPDDINTFRLNESFIDMSKADSIAEYSSLLSEFYIPEWWSEQIKNITKNKETNFERTVYLKIMTPENIEPGKYTLKIESIVIEGKYINQIELIFILGFSLLFLLVFQLTTLYSKNRIKAKQVIEKQKELKKVNEALEIESKELKNLVTRDHLTGIRNRHGIRDLLLSLISNMEDSNYHLSAMYLDLDNFKNINDTYGHDVGDKVLVQFAQLISNNIRENDVFARWGGEEFILITPEFGCLKARLFAEKLRLLIEDQCWPENIALTCSIGVTEYIPKEDISELLKRADNALYQSKAKGRNRSTLL